MKKQLREIRIVFIIFSAIFSLIGYKLYDNAFSYLFLGTAAVLLITLTISPLALKPLFDRWVKVALVIGKVNTVILLTFFFIFAFVPVGFFFRLTGKKLLKRSFANQDSYWEPCTLSGLKDTKRYEKQF